MIHHRFSETIPQTLVALLLVGLMFSLTVGTAHAVPSTPELEVEDNTVNVNGPTTISVPVLLTTNEQDLLFISFTLTYDVGCLDFDDITDSNHDDVPDSITVDVLPGFDVSYEEPLAPGDVTLSILAAPPFVFPLVGMGEYSSRALAHIEFDVLPTCPNPDNVLFAFGTSEYASVLGAFGDVDTIGGTYELLFNSTPVSISLAPTDVDENQPPDTPIGTLETADPARPLAPAADYSYSLQDNECDAPPSYSDNSVYWIDGDQLKTAIPLDYEQAETHHICVRSMDSLGMSASQAFTITINDLNEIADIQLSGANASGEYHVSEDEAVDYDIGQFSTIDHDVGRTYGYTLENGGCGDTFNDNLSFKIANGDWLQTDVLFNHASQSIYNICVRTTDQADGTNYLDRTFTILIDDVTQDPVAVNDYSVAQPLVVRLGNTTPVFVLDNDTDPDGDVLKVNAGSGPGFSVTRHDFRLDVFPFGTSGPGTVTYTAKDDPLGNLSNEATVYLYKIRDDIRGDCNHDGNVDAGDLVATVLELGDDDGGVGWWLTSQGDHAGSALGCDSNGLRNLPDDLTPSVDASDLTCTVLLFFGKSCGGVAAASVAPGSTPTLHVADGLEVAAGESVVAPVVLDTSGQNVAAVAFTLNFDPAVLELDETDADSDGVADAVNLNVPAAMARVVTVDAQAGRIQVALFGTSLPLSLLQDGVVANIALEAKTDVAESTSPLELTGVSLGDDLGQSVSVIASGNNVVIGASGSGQQIFLPQLHAQSDLGK